jgi:hypothetical protein
MTDANKLAANINNTLKLAAFCGACLPGYWPIYISDSLVHIVVTCT